MSGAALPELLARLGIPLEPDALRAGSGGEVTSPEMLAWAEVLRTGELTPVPGGLFCHQIFGAEGTRFGHIELAAPLKMDDQALACIPVLPPQHRRIVRRGGTTVAVHPWNDLYRRLIHRNERLKKLRSIPDVPDSVREREEALLGDAVRALWASPPGEQPKAETTRSG